MKQTLRNLERIIKQLDVSSGSLYNALDNLAEMEDLPEKFERLTEIDVSEIDSLRHELELIVERRREERKRTK